MTPAARVKYHRDLWPAACRAQGWDQRSDELRRAAVLDCMRQVRGPIVTTSSPRFGADETTALFTYLVFLARQDSLDASANWDECKRDYRAFNRARNADWHERQTYGAKGSAKLQRDRFARRKTAAGDVLDELDADEVRKRHITMAQRHRDKLKREKQVQTPRTHDEQVRLVPSDRTVIALPPPAELEPVDVAAGDPDPAYVPPTGQPF